MSNTPDFELITKLKDSNSSNLNEVFESYGCSTLEAKVPIVDRPMVDQLKGAETREQILGTLALKSEAASHAMKGRAPRTRNKDLRVVEVGGQFILETGEERERSPVDRGELDDELETYARERARIKANRMGIELPEYVPLPSSSTAPKPETRARVKREIVKKEVENEENWDEEEKEPERDDLDDDIDRYMQEAARKRAQKKKLTEQLDGMDVMMRMEDDSEELNRLE